MSNRLYNKKDNPGERPPGGYTLWIIISFLAAGFMLYALAGLLVKLGF